MPPNRYHARPSGGRKWRLSGLQRVRALAGSFGRKERGRFAVPFARVALALLLLVWPLGLLAQSSPYTLYQHKALYLFNFAKYTEWPKEAFSDDSAPFVLGILGQDPFRSDIDIIKGKTIKGRRLVV